MMLNEIDSKSLDLKFEYVPAAEHLKAGMVSDHLYAYENGQKVGYLKIDRIDPILFKSECPDVWAFKQEFEGQILFSNTATPVSQKPFEELVKALRSGYLHRHVSYWVKEMKWPEDQAKVINDITNEYQTKPSEWNQYHDLVVKFFTEWDKKTSDGKRVVKSMKDKYSYLTKPFVAYINTKENRNQGVEADNSRRGIGTALYIAGAKWIKERKLGPGLYASSVQSDDAQAVWKKFEKKGLVVTDGKRKYLIG